MPFLSGAGATVNDFAGALSESCRGVHLIGHLRLSVINANTQKPINRYQRVIGSRLMILPVGELGLRPG